MEVENPFPGVVIVRGALNLDQQLQVIDIVKRNSKLKTDSGEWNFLGFRGRHFSGIARYPGEDATTLNKHCVHFKNVTEGIDKSLTFAPVTHMLTLWYPDSKGMGWHRDSYGGNNGDEGAPVYSLTLGNSCVFEYKLVEDNKADNNADNKADTKARHVTLNSGDLIVFGGPQRLMMHRVKTVHKGSFDKLADFDARINLTFRTCTDFNDDDENAYQTDAYAARLKAKWSNKDALI